MTYRENILRAIRFEHPEYIPMTFSVSESCYTHYEPEALFDLFESHPLLFPGYERPRNYVRPDPKDTDRKRVYTDEFGVEWMGAIDGIRGVVQKHPLEDFSKIASYKMPELPKFDIEAGRAEVERIKAAGGFASAGLEHGHTFLRLTDLCGYENVLCGLYDGDEELLKLVDMIGDYNCYFIDNYVKMGYDMIGYAEDLGMQNGPMISPELFVRYIKPVYQRLMKPARDAGCIVHMHSDGDIRALAGDLIDGGVDVLNLQDLVNGIDWIKDNIAGKYCIDLDIDRQNVTVFGTPSAIDALIREEVEKLSSPAGGLMMIHGCYPGPSLQNIGALMDAMEKYMYYWA